MLEQLLEEIEDLKKAKKLLEEVFHAVGPYEHDAVPDELRWKICDYFKFDDSE